MKDKKHYGSAGAGASSKKEGKTLANQLVNLKEEKKMKEVKEMSGEEAEMKCIVCNYMYIWWEINSLSFIYTAHTDAQGPKMEKCM